MAVSWTKLARHLSRLSVKARDADTGADDDDDDEEEEERETDALIARKSISPD